MPRESEPPVENKPENQCPACGSVSRDSLSRYCPKHLRDLREQWSAREVSKDGGITHLEHQEAFRILETDRGAESRDLKAEYRMVERLWDRLLGPAPRGGR